MDAQFENQYHNLENSHWWFKARQDWVLTQLKNTSKEKKILEVGSASGALVLELQEKGYSIIGSDFSETAVDRALSKGCKKMIQADAQQLPFPDEQFDYIIASDVLEHLKDDKKALLEWNRVLKKGGTLILGVPAFQWMWSDHDEKNHHYRRYTQAQIKDLLLKSNFSIPKISYWNFLLFFPIALLRLINKSTKKSEDLKMPASTINTLLLYWLKLENKWLQYLPLPIGLSIVSSCYKK